MTGAAMNFGWISGEHADYLRLGGIDGFVGDGHLSPAPETALDLFYSVSLHRSYWLSGDYQHIANPGFNSDRGPVKSIQCSAAW